MLDVQVMCKRIFDVTRTMGACFFVRPSRRDSRRDPGLGTWSGGLSQKGLTLCTDRWHV